MPWKIPIPPSPYWMKRFFLNFFIEQPQSKSMRRQPLPLDVEHRAGRDVPLAFGFPVELEHHQLVRHNRSRHLVAAEFSGRCVRADLKR